VAGEAAIGRFRDAGESGPAGRGHQPAKAVGGQGQAEHFRPLDDAAVSPSGGDAGQQFRLAAAVGGRVEIGAADVDEAQAAVPVVAPQMGHVEAADGAFPVVEEFHGIGLGVHVLSFLSVISVKQK